jgi:SNF2 family DNA or RNA helicase
MPLLSPSPLPARLDVACDWSDKELIKQVPGARWDASRKMWHVPMTWAAYVQLHGTFNGRMTVAPDLVTWAFLEQQDNQAARTWRDVIDPGVEIPGLYPWQVADYYWLAFAGSGLLGNDQGTGKTISCLVALRGLPETLPALVVSPNSVKRVWEQEAAKWFPEAHVYVIGGGAAGRQKTLTKALADPMALIVINYESLRSHSRLAPYGSIALKRCVACGGDDPKIKPGQCHAHPKELNGTEVLRTVVLDEAQALKDPKSQQTRAVWAVCHDPSVTRRIAMTGTPIANHIGDLWSIMHAVAREEYPVRSTWLDRYAQLQWNAFGGMDIVGLRQDHAEEFFSFFDARYRRVTKAQAAPWLPSKYRSVRYAPLPTKMRKAYDELEEQLITRFDDGTIVFAPNTLSQTTRLLQVSSAYGTTQEDGSYRMVEPSPKIDVLMEILEETEGRQIVACALSKQLINLAAARLEKAAVPFGLITGDIHELDRRRALNEFQNGRLRVLLFTIGAGGVGLTMTAADTIIFLQRSWSLIQNLQAEDRVHRLGSEIHEAIHIIDVIAPDTVEEWQIQRIHEKLIRLEEIRRDGIDLSTNIGDDIRHAQ